MTKTNLLTGGGGRNHVADLYIFHGDHHTINEQLDQLPLLLKSGLRETTTDSLAKRSDGARQANQLHLLMDVCFNLTSLVIQSLQSLLEILASSLVLSQRKHSRHVGFRESLQLATQARSSLAHLCSSRLQFLREPFAALCSMQSLLFDLRLLEHFTDVLPDELI